MRGRGLAALLILGSSCVAPKQPEADPPVSGIGGMPAEVEEEPACSCEVLARTESTVQVELECLCAEFARCPSSDSEVTTPSELMVWSRECQGRISYAVSLGIDGSTVYTFDQESGALVGMEYGAAQCGAYAVLAGDGLESGCEAAWCLLSWGPEQVAAPGECLDPGEVTPPEKGTGWGGAGGEPGGFSGSPSP